MSSFVLQQCNILTREGYVFGNLHLGNGIIERVEVLGEPCEGAPCALPGLFDVHTHGGWGMDFNSADSRQMAQLLDHYYEKGVTSLLATVMTDSEQRMCEQLGRVAHLAKTHGNLKGIHLEGPFLSQEYCGAQPKEYLRLCSIELFERFQQKAEGMIKLLTLSPEVEGACELTEYVSKRGVKVSLGHSRASATQTHNVCQSGALSFTHLLNAMPYMDKRQPNITNYALLGNTYAEVIADGHHLHPLTVKLLYNAVGEDRVIGITDSIAPSFLPNGQYALSNYRVTKQDNDVFIDGTDKRAGSVISAYDALHNMSRYCDIDLARAIKCFTLNPCNMLNMTQFGTLEKGKDADILLTNCEKITAVYAKGRQVF